MKKSVASLVVLLLISASASAVTICDLDPAPFVGQPNTTHQTWSFSDDTKENILPDAGYTNPYGTPEVDVVGNFSTNTLWLPQDQGHDGVWVIDRSLLGEMIITIPNDEQPRKDKHIWLQMTYASWEDWAPMLYVVPEGDLNNGYVPMTLVNKYQLPGDEYWHAVYSLTINPNPTLEQIYIRPRDCTVYIDCITVDTQCIPEPMTIGLLGLGSLLLRRRIA